MKVNDLIRELKLETLVLADGGREINGAYAGDLLSWVMGRAKSGNVWVTIMTNINTIAVASLADVACVVISEGCDVPQEVMDVAEAKEINLLRSSMATYELCAALSLKI